MIKAFSLFELLIYTCIAMILSMLAVPKLQHLVYLQTANLTMQQLELTLNYARSIAILHKTKIQVCPSIDGVKCAKVWGHGLLVTNERDFKYFTPFYLKFTGNIHLRQSGRNNYQLTIESNGMTSSNGHFNLKTAKPGVMAEFNLYFNKGLRFYTTGLNYEQNECF